MHSSIIQKYGGISLITTLGAGLFLTHVGHALNEDENLQTFLLGIALPMVCTICVLVGGFWLWQRGLENEFVLRVGVWCALGAMLLALADVFIILYQQQYGVMMDEQLFVVVNGASAGSLVGFVTGIYDTRQRRAQATADELNRQLTVLNRVLRHDIRNSATVIRGNADMLTSESADTAARVETIKQQATDLVNLGDQAQNIEQILIEQGTSRESIDIVPLLKECCTRVRRDYPSAEIDVSLPSTLPVVSHHLIGSALLNVIENAVEHNDKSTPHVTVESTSVSRDGVEYVELQIADNGPGITDSEIDVLNRGYETNLEHTTGLGLWLVNWIVTNGDGEIQFGENDPEGTIVRLRLKYAEESNPSDTVSDISDAVT